MMNAWNFKITLLGLVTSFSVGSGSVMTLKAGSGSGQNHYGSTTLPTGSEVRIKALLITN